MRIFMEQKRSHFLFQRADITKVGASMRCIRSVKMIDFSQKKY